MGWGVIMIDFLDKLAIRFYNWCIITFLVDCGAILLLILVLAGYDDTKYTEIFAKTHKFVMELIFGEGKQ